MKQFGILVGCNDFGVEGASLRGCVNDLRSMYEMLATFYNYSGWEFDFLIDERNTAEAQRNLFWKIVSQANKDDIIAFHNSGHGTRVPVNGKIEHANCAYQFDWSRIEETFVLGSQYRAIVDEASRKGVRVYFTTDSCNSGKMLNRGLLSPGGRMIVSRFMEQPLDIQWKIEHLLRSGVKAPRALMPEMDNLCFASGCGEKETDYSADVGGVDPATGEEKWFGAFTHYFCQTVLANKDKTWEQNIAQECTALATDNFDQRPTSYGGLAGIVTPYQRT